jgi:hypothetical protein
MLQDRMLGLAQCFVQTMPELFYLSPLFSGNNKDAWCVIPTFKKYFSCWVYSDNGCKQNMTWSSILNIRNGQNPTEFWFLICSVCTENIFCSYLWKAYFLWYILCRPHSFFSGPDLMDFPLSSCYRIIYTKDFFQRIDLLTNFAS